MNVNRKITDTYRELNRILLEDKFVNDIETRDYVRSVFHLRLGKKFTVKCDQENNPSDIIKLKLMAVRIMWDDENKNNQYFYINIILGDPEVAKVYHKTSNINYNGKERKPVS